jgi:hypothetical protein
MCPVLLGAIGGVSRGLGTDCQSDQSVNTSPMSGLKGATVDVRATLPDALSTLVSENSKRTNSRTSHNAKEALVFTD